MLGLYVVTCGLVGMIWPLWRKKFLDGLVAGMRLGVVAWFPAVLTVLGVALTVAVKASDGAGADTSLFQAVSNLGGLALVIASFRVKSILDRHFQQTGVRTRWLSSIGTFFLGPLYLQYKINQAADRELQARGD